MSSLEKIASMQNRSDEIPNKELARDLATSGDQAGVQEIAENLWNKDPQIQSDCLKVLYEIGYLRPNLIAGLYPDFLKLLKSKNNRLVWGAMIAMGTIAPLKADELVEHIPEIKQGIEKGTVITVDNGVKVLAGIASTNVEYRRVIFPYLVDHIRTCRPKDIPQHAEKILPAVDSENKSEFIQALENRMDGMAGSEASRVRRIIREAGRR